MVSENPWVYDVCCFSLERGALGEGQIMNFGDVVDWVE